MYYFTGLFMKYVLSFLKNKEIPYKNSIRLILHHIGISYSLLNNDSLFETIFSFSILILIFPYLMQQMPYDIQR